jgi:alkanesulfonate monooxygenase SsuD/methylene tetrahydromethanopterin reductase-like flavin-dependent oxidoreductase (luciferase family)
LDIKPGQRPLEVDLLAAQGLEEFAIFGRHACGYYVAQAGGSKASQKPSEPISKLLSA